MARHYAFLRSPLRPAPTPETTGRCTVESRETPHPQESTMDKFSKILVAIRDPARRAQRAVKKAADLAASSGARLELFHAISEPLYEIPTLSRPQTLLPREDAIRARHLQKLERLAAPLRQRGLMVTCSATWDFPAAHAIVRQSLKSRVDLIVADSRASHTGRWFLRFTDWELLRLSAKPVLLVKSARAYGKSPIVLAALDPAHAADKPARLDAEILAIAGLLRRQTGGKLHTVHAYVPAATGLRPEQMAREGFSERLEARTRTHAARSVARELKAARLTDAESHLVGLHPVNAIPDTARNVRATAKHFGKDRRQIYRWLELYGVER